MGRALRLIGILLLVVLVAGVVNMVVVDNETAPASADLGEVLELEGPDLQVREDGAKRGPAIVLAHCYSCSMKWWAPVAERLATDHRVVSVDLVGHGGSEKPIEGYEIGLQARQVWRALDELGIEQAVLAGHSMGGDVVTAMAEEQPERALGVVVVGTPSAADQGELPLTARLGYVPLLGEAIRRVVPDSLVRRELASAFGPDHPVPDFAVSDFRRLTYSAYDNAHHAANDYVEAEAPAARVAAVGTRLLDIQGNEDEVVDPEPARDGWAEVEGARVVALPGVGHSPPLEDPGQTADLIAEFAAEVGRSER